MSGLLRLRLGALFGMLISFLGLTAFLRGGRYEMGIIYLLAAPGLAGCAVMAGTGIYAIICRLRRAHSARPERGGALPGQR